MSAAGILPETFRGEVIGPNDTDYESARLVWNALIDRHPALIARPLDVADIQVAVRHARECDLRVAVRCGGHSISGYSAVDDGIVIDLSAMRGVHVDPAARQARVRGGSLLSQLDRAAQQHGLACPVGVVGHTGVGGLTLGGGMGRLQRRHGLTIDNLRGVELVSADGAIVRASAQDNPELFWGLRGAGPNFGIVTNFEFGLHPIGPVVTAGVLMHRIERLDDVLEVYLDLVENGSDDTMITFAFARALPEDDFPLDAAGQPVAFLNLVHSGPVDAGEAVVARLRALGPALMDTMAVKPYLDVQGANDEYMRWGQRFYMKSGFLRDFPSDLVPAIVETVATGPGDVAVSLWPWGRAIAEVPDEDMAFTGRGAAYWFGTETVWTDPADDAAMRDWSRSAWQLMQTHASTGRYVNDVSETDAGTLAEVYGTAKLDRLRALKRAYDPDNVFRMNQNITP